ncbi:hypothetical protein [Lysinibacillus xylanilyticus]|uniref:Uncharacterized protein n=1 Tax=Lysinibacillus xylanilyticus TaxID=582475 RepID=A0ABT4EQN2_9BACI|nr:hypothetical protein [Lysinibacillus xylanilyticus]MCY9547308.1 hypothetical protein [Lysinibacillus xylanilyticus]
MDQDYEFKHKKEEYFSKLIFDGFISALNSHKTLFKTLDSKKETHGLTIAFAYLTEAHNYYLNAATLLAVDVELLDIRSEFDRLFYHFSEYNKAVLEDTQATLSHQWSDTKFRDFVNSFKKVANLLNIVGVDFFVNEALSSDKK